MNGDRSEAGILRLTVELFMLPVRTFLDGMERMVATLKDIQRATDHGTDSFLSDPLGGHRQPPRAPAFEPTARTPADIGGRWPGPEPRELEPAAFLEPPTAGGARDGAGEPTSKEDSRMYTDQDLSGNMVKVVQYCIVSVFTRPDEEAAVIVPPRVKAFADDMTAEDFTSWMIAENQTFIREWDSEHGLDNRHGPSPANTKYLRVAFSVMGRFSPADIDWEQLQAGSVYRIAERIAPRELPAADARKTRKTSKG